MNKGVSEMEGDMFSDIGHGIQVDGKVLQTFQQSFGQVQNLLDQNRLLIHEINQNHESKIPDNLSRNPGLIRELNNNIRRVVDIYADLSTSFANSVEASLFVFSFQNSAAFSSIGLVVHIYFYVLFCIFCFTIKDHFFSPPKAHSFCFPTF